jgi:diphthamide synthase (EF-2-diphthine--ammonia ligase)
VTTLTFVVTCDYIDFFLANVTVNHNVHTFTIIVHGYLFHSFLINVVNYNGVCRSLGADSASFLIGHEISKLVKRCCEQLKYLIKYSNAITEHFYHIVMKFSNY